MAPEYVNQGIVSTKCDVFAFGVTLLGTIVGSMSVSTPRLAEPIQWVSTS
jgi:L1 cell adhesion molecule like protein